MSSQYDFTEAVRQARAGAALPGIPATLRAQLLALLCLNLSDPEAARTCVEQGNRMLSDEAPLVRNVGSWMAALLADFEGRPEEAMAVLDGGGACRAEALPCQPGRSR
ncbi:hypothetical protein ACFV2U_39775 [Streptomyces sp. NPDC059697]|uniref:hypothetical protein n=1 Tax=Streptomyces sp. NPDC059697 TaxID=3346912 RepID=UPI00368C5989